MSILDFREIPEAHKGGGLQDTFEQFATEFLEFLNLKILERPSRGPDGGKDLVVEESRQGNIGTSKVRFLVSCKHKAFSGKSVSPTDESDIGDRVKANHCKGFLGIYSTIPSSGLMDKIRGLDLEAEVYDNRRIERELLVPRGLKLAKRYFPLSIRQWLKENPSPVPVFEQIQTIECEICGRNLLDKIRLNSFLGGVLIYCTRRDEADSDDPPIADVRWYCKVKCMGAMDRRVRKQGLEEDGWDDVHDYMHPARFVTLLLANFDNISLMTPQAKEKYSHFLAAAFQYVAREMTTTEQEILKRMRGVGLAV